MKIIRTIFFTLLAMGLIAGTAVFILFQTFDPDQYLSRIAKKASDALGRPVFITNASLGLSRQGITLDIGPVTIADDPAFTDLPLIKIDRVRFCPDLTSMVLNHKIQINSIVLQSPQLHIIRSQQGVFNIHSLGQRSMSLRLAGPGGSQPISPPQRAIPERAVNASSWRQNGRTRQLLESIKYIKIQDASISYIDQNSTFPVDFWLTGINAKAKNVSFDKPFSFSALGHFYTEGPSTMGHNSTGKVRINMTSLDVELSRGLQAQGNINISGVIQSFNIIHALLSQLLGGFGMEGGIDNILSGPLKDKLVTPKDTVIKSARVQFSYRDKRLFIDDLLLQTNIFEFSAKGTMDPDLDLNLDTMLHLNTDVSAAFVDEFNGFGSLRDESRRIAIGARLTGVIPHLKYKPNKEFRKKSTRALMQEGGNILGVLLGGDKSSNDGQGAQENAGKFKKHKNRFNIILKNLLQ